MKKQALRVGFNLAGIALWVGVIALVANSISGWSAWSIGVVAVASVCLALAAFRLLINSISLWLYATSSPEVRTTLGKTAHLR